MNLRVPAGSLEITDILYHKDNPDKIIALATLKLDTPQYDTNIYLLDSYWNHTPIEQKIGRAYRNPSHTEQVSKS